MLTGSLIIAFAIFAAIVYHAHVIEQALTDQHFELPDQLPDQTPMETPYYGDESFGSDELHRKNSAFDEKIAKMQEELDLFGSEQLHINEHFNARPGTIFEEDHKLVDSQYIRIPKEEYAE